MEALDAIHDIDELEGYAVVGPGVVNADLKRAAAAAGLHYGPNPALTALAVFDSLDVAVAGIVALRRDPHLPGPLMAPDGDGWHFAARPG